MAGLEDGLVLRVTVPPGANGSVSVPMLQMTDFHEVVIAETAGVDAATVWARGAFVPGPRGVLGGRAQPAKLYNPGAITFTVASGTYQFETSAHV
mmetsp:Transcript_12968/g.45029  ORF Transcript_12968/g.45029 Transcript_12968/m.45029 type:complete len:95 (-) Transcript_12968:7-291(-)